MKVIQLKSADWARSSYPLIMDESHFIVRSTGIRSLIVDGVECSFSSVVKKIMRNVKIKLNDSSKHIKCGVKRVKLRIDKHPKQNPETGRSLFNCG